MSNRLTEIIQRLELISLETKSLTRELRELQQRDERDARRANGRATQDTTRSARAPDRSVLHSFETGQPVEITNAYGYLQGTRGIVTHATRTKINIVDSTGRTHTRKYNNVRLL
jgi:hypothetical protein